MEESKAVLHCYLVAARMEKKTLNFHFLRFNTAVSNRHAFETNTLPSSGLLTLLLILVKVRHLRSITHDDRFP